MKTRILTIIALLGITPIVLAAAPETLVVSVGQQKTTVRGKITIKVVAILEDSRCPVGVSCIWAGNAKVKITLAKGKKAAKSLELNSMLKPEMIIFEGYDLRLVDLTPRPGEQVQRRAFDATATLSITKHLK